MRRVRSGCGAGCGLVSGCDTISRTGDLPGVVGRGDAALAEKAGEAGGSRPISLFLDIDACIVSLHSSLEGSIDVESLLFSRRVLGAKGRRYNGCDGSRMTSGRREGTGAGADTATG